MKNSTARCAPSRRRIIKGAGVAGGRHRRAGVLEHPLGLCRLSGPPGQDHGGQYARRPVRSRRPHRRGGACSNRPARPSSSRTSAAPAAISAWAMPRAPSRTATRSCSRPTPIRSTPALYNKIPYDPHKDFVGVSELATSPNTFVVKSELPAKTMKEFVALAAPIPTSSTARRRRSAPRRKSSSKC